MSNGSQNHYILQIVGFKLCMAPLIAQKLFIMLIIIQSISHIHSTTSVSGGRSKRHKMSIAGYL